MKKIFTAMLACAMIVSSLCACAQKQPEDSGFPEPLPSRYILSDLGLVTPHKDQDQTGLCAAYAAISACESNLLVNGYENVDDLDLSEAHLYYYNYSYADDLGSDDKDDFDSGEDGYYLNIDRKDSKKTVLEMGSYPRSLVALLANGGGPVDENVVEFDPHLKVESVIKLNEAHSNGDIEKFMGDYLVTDAYFLTNTDKEFLHQDSFIIDLKTSIYEHGAAAVGTTTSQFYLNKSEAGVTYYEGILSEEFVYDRVGHAVCVVGWDDNFSREHFGRNKPDYDGAWLIKDSCAGYYDEYYYWLSYEQKLTSFTTFELVPRDEYGDILFYDSLRMHRYIVSEGEETVTANVFNVDKDCRLKAVGVPCAAQNQPVTIEVYRNPDENVPQSGKRVAKLETVIDMPGYHVVDLKKAVKLSEGDSFSIVVSYEICGTGEDDWIGRVPVEGSESLDDKGGGAVSFFKTVVTAEPGQSYVVYNGKWYDTSDPATAGLFGLDVPINNFGIKALMEKE